MGETLEQAATELGKAVAAIGADLVAGRARLCPVLHWGDASDWAAGLLADADARIAEASAAWR